MAKEKMARPPMMPGIAEMGPQNFGPEYRNGVRLQVTSPPPRIAMRMAFVHFPIPSIANPSLRARESKPIII